MKTREMTPVPTTIYRCGTSKGIFLHENDLPADSEIRDQVILSIFGSPDPRQIDGLGGAEVLTSKLAIIGPGSVAGADVDYTFGQVDITTPYISYSGLCGNIPQALRHLPLKRGWFAQWNRSQQFAYTTRIRTRFLLRRFRLLIICRLLTGTMWYPAYPVPVQG